MCFKPLVSGDAAFLASLHATGAATSWSAQGFADLLRHQGRFGWLAELGSVPAGYILIQVIAEEAEILSLVVAPEHQRLGIGTRLVSKALEVARGRGARRLLLEVAVSNSAARALYEGLGFRRIGERRGYYQRPGGLEDALVMAYVWVERRADAEGRKKAVSSPSELED